MPEKLGESGWMGLGNDVWLAMCFRRYCLWNMKQRTRSLLQDVSVSASKDRAGNVNILAASESASVILNAWVEVGCRKPAKEAV